MLTNIWMMTKSTLKLLLRNKGFILIVFIVPVLATLLLNIKLNSAKPKQESSVYEIDDMNKQLAYLEDYTKCAVVVYDTGSYRPAVLQMCREFAKTDMFEFFISASDGYSQNDIEKHIDNITKNDKINAVVWIDSDAVFHLYQIGTDERYALLSPLLMTYDLTQPENNPSIDVAITLASASGTSDYSTADAEASESFGYTIAIITAAFLFTGILILSILLQEKQNLVVTRIMLSCASMTQYMLAKLLVVFIVTAIQTIITGAAFQFLVSADIGINIFQYMLLVFTQGIIFTLFAICVGILFNNILNACYMSFITWALSAMLAGLYFPLTDSSEWYKNISSLMPERWAVKACELFITGDASAYPMILCVTIAYLVVILVIGIFGIRLTAKE